MELDLPHDVHLAEKEDFQDCEAPSAFERLRYLCPSRYFRYYMFYDRCAKRTCWLPQGYDS